MIEHYFYDGQIKTYMRQFASIFTGLQVQTGKGECGTSEFIPVPCVVGSKDRVVGMVFAGGTQNRLFALPLMSFYLSSLTIAPDRHKLPAIVHKTVAMPTGGSFPEDLTVVKRVVPAAYNMSLELSIWASNQDQMYQILEQILVMFNPDIQIQRSDAPYDWTKLTTVKLTDISNEENYPSGTSKRAIVWTLRFEMPIWLSIPMAVRDEIVRRVVITIASNGAVAPQELLEVDDNGVIMPFGEPAETVVVTQEDVMAGL